MTFARVFRFGSAALLALALSMPAYAQTAKPSPEHVALARAVLDFTGARNSFDNVIPKLLTDARNNILRTQPTLQPVLDETALEIAKKLATADEELINNIAVLYAQKLTEDELRQIASFYQSPAGKKMTEVLPGILNDSFGLMQEWSRKMSVQVMTELRAEMKKKGHDI